MRRILLTVLFCAAPFGQAADTFAFPLQPGLTPCLAIENYRRSLALDPKNGNVVEWLKALGTPAAP